MSQADILIPVPLHRFRLWKRRFNQAALLTQQLAKATQRPLALDVLTRKRATITQVGLKRVQRLANLKNAFSVPETKQLQVAGRRVLLIDDVMTTGSTATAASLALLEAGAAVVDVLVFALVAEPFRTHI